MYEDDQSSIDVELTEVADWFRRLMRLGKVPVSRTVRNDEQQCFRPAVGVLGQQRLPV